MKSSRFNWVLGFVCVLSVVAAPSFTAASDWDGANGGWSSIVSPGWLTGGVPDAPGAVASNATGLTGITTQDIVTGAAATPGVIIGKLTLGGATNSTWTITPTNPITFNVDGPGNANLAEISNTNTGAGAANGLTINAGTLTLADDLLINNNQTASTRATGAIIVTAAIGGAGNITFSSDVNAFPSPTGSFPGAIRLAGTNTFTGNSLLKKGIVTFNLAGAFGPALTNTITLGNAAGSTTLLSTAAVTVANPIIVNSPDDGVGSADTVTLGSISTSTGALGYSGNVTLNSDVIVTGQSLTGNGTNFSGAISGVGGITKQEPGTITAPGLATLSGTNTYTGPTVIKTGQLQFAKQVSLYNNQQGGLANYWSDPSKLIVEAGAAAVFNVGGTGEFTATDLQGLMTMSTVAGGFKAGSGIGFNTANAVGGNFDYGNAIVDTAGGANSIGVVKFGANKLTLSAANSYTNKTIVAQGTLQFAKKTSLYNNTPASWNTTNLIFFPGTTATFNVGGTGEFDAGDIDLLKSLGTATAGFIGTNVAAATSSSIGFDTTNAAGGVFTYNNGIANPNAGQNPLGLTKTGAGELVLTGASTYTGSTIVDGGILRLTNTASHTVDPVTPGPTQVVVTNEVGNYFIGNAAGTTGELIVDGANITSDNGLYVGQNGTGKMTLNSGTVIVKADDNGAANIQLVSIGRNAGSDGTYIQNGGELRVGATGNSDWFIVGQVGTGRATLNNGAINASVVALGRSAGSNGTLTIKGGTVKTAFEAYLNTSTTSTSTLNIEGGTFETTAFLRSQGGTSTINQSGGNLKLGTYLTLNETAGTSTYNMSGGTMSTGNITSERFVVGRSAGTTTVNQTGGDITVRNQWLHGWLVGAISEYNISGNATVTVVNSNGFVGLAGTAVLNQSGGTIKVNGAFSSLGREGGSGTYNMSGGTAEWGRGINTDFNIGDVGNGTLNHTGGTIYASRPIIAYNTGATGYYKMDGAMAVMNVTGTGGGFYVGNNGTGTFDMIQGTLNVINPGLTMTDASGNADFRVSNGSGAGTVTQTGGTINVSNHMYIGIGTGTATYNMNGGNANVGDNLYVAVNANSNGTLKQTAGTITLVGNDPAFTGNMLVGYNALGTFEMEGGTINFAVPSTTTRHSASYSAGLAATPETQLALAQDGNLSIGGLAAGSGTMSQSGGTINVAANLLIGANGGTALAGGTGTLNLSGAGVLNVGVSSPEGGDLYMAATETASATVNLSGGTLNVANGSGKIGAGVGGANALFNFTGGTLKVKVFNAGDFGGNLGDLVQNGSGSLLDVTGNNTDVEGARYNLGIGTTNIGAGHSLAAAGVLNSDGAGIINVGNMTAAGDYNNNGKVDAADYVLWRKNPTLYGGTPANAQLWRGNFGISSTDPAGLSVGAGTVAVDTLNLNNGIVTANGGVSVATALNGNGSITGSVTMGPTTTVSPGVGGIGTINFNNNLALDSNVASKLIVDVNASGLGSSDLLNVLGNITLGGTVQVNVIGANPALSQEFTIAQWVGTQSGPVTLPVSATGTWSSSVVGNLFKIKFLAPGAGSGLDGATVPEPTTFVLLAMAACGFFGRRSARSRG